MKRLAASLLSIPLVVVLASPAQALPKGGDPAQACEQGIAKLAEYCEATGG